MVKRVSQVFMKPGRYAVGRNPDGSLVYHTVTRQEIADYVTGTKQLLAAGFAPPVLFEHADPGSDEGAPKSRRDEKADLIRHGAGWLADVAIGDDGAASYVLDVTDSEAARKIDEGSIKFTSPEFRSAWIDGAGNVHRNIWSHVALVHRPKNADQSPLVEVRQFSLEDLMADDDEKDDEKAEFGGDASQKGDPVNGGEPAADGEAEAPVTSEPAVPDAPEDTDAAGKQAERVKAICLHLEELGIVLPEDTFDQEMPTILDRILTGLKTAAAVKKQSEAEESVDDEAEEGGEPQVIEQQGMLQYSLENLNACKNKMLARVIRGEVSGLERRIGELADSWRVTPAMKKKLVGVLPSLQFSAEADLRPSVTLDDFLTILEDLPPGICMDGPAVLAQFSAEEHPDGDKHYLGGDITSPEQAQKIVDAQEAAGVKGLAKR